MTREDSIIMNFLKDNNVRISAGMKWLIVDGDDEIIVYRRTSRARHVTVLYSGTSISDALEILGK
jgi:hypothetical protein